MKVCNSSRWRLQTIPVDALAMFTIQSKAMTEAPDRAPSIYGGEYDSKRALSARLRAEVAAIDAELLAADLNREVAPADDVSVEALLAGEERTLSDDRIADLRKRRDRLSQADTKLRNEMKAIVEAKHRRMAEERRPEHLKNVKAVAVAAEQLRKALVAEADLRGSLPFRMSLEPSGFPVPPSSLDGWLKSLDRRGLVNLKEIRR